MLECYGTMSDASLFLLLLSGLFAWRRQLVDAAIVRLMKRLSPQTLTELVHAAQETCKQRLLVTADDVASSIDRLCAVGILARRTPNLSTGGFEVHVVYAEDQRVEAMPLSRLAEVLQRLQVTAMVQGKCLWALLILKLQLPPSTLAVASTDFHLGLSRMSLAYRTQVASGTR